MNARPSINAPVPLFLLASVAHLPNHRTQNTRSTHTHTHRPAIDLHMKQYITCRIGVAFERRWYMLHALSCFCLFSVSVKIILFGIQFVTASHFVQFHFVFGVFLSNALWMWTEKFYVTFLCLFGFILWPYYTRFIYLSFRPMRKLGRPSYKHATQHIFIYIIWRTLCRLGPCFSRASVN